MRRPTTSLAEAVTDIALGADAAVCIDEFLDAFYGANAATRQAMLDDEPQFVGDARQDAFVGAVAEHLARRWALAIPAWAADDRRDVSEPWFMGRMGQALSGLFLVESPIAFRRRRIFTEAEPLRRARMPPA